MGGVAELDLTRPADLLASAMAQLPGLSLLVVDAEYRVLTGCGSAAAHPQCSTDELLGRRLPDVLPAESWAALQPVCAAALAGRTFTADDVCTRSSAIVEWTGTSARTSPT